MRTFTENFYTVHVLRDKTLIQYNAEKFPSQADAKVFAERLGEYVEIRRVRIIHESTTVERVEA